MKKIIFILILFPVTGFGQSNNASPRFGVKIGFGLSNVGKDYTLNGTSYKYESVGGLQAGVLLQVPLSKHFIFQPEAMLSVKGTDESTDDYPSYPLRTTVIELPLNLVYKIPTKANAFTIGGGPFIALGREYYSRIFSNKMDIGANVLASYEWPLGVLLTLSYTKGFSKINSEDALAPRLTTNCVALCIGYIF
jgi:hypothetical protein